MTEGTTSEVSSPGSGSYPPSSCANARAPLAVPPPVYLPPVAFPTGALPAQPLRQPTTASPAYMHEVFTATEAENAANARTRRYSLSDLSLSQRQQVLRYLNRQSNPQAEEELNRKLYVVYRNKLRRTYALPVLTWVPSFVLILYYAISQNNTARQNGTAPDSGIYTWTAVGVWVLLLLVTCSAYMVKALRLKKMSALGILQTLSEEELNDIIMNGAGLSAPPDYNLADEPLPAYPAAGVQRNGSVRSVATSVRTWLGGRLSLARGEEAAQPSVGMEEIRVDELPPTLPRSSTSTPVAVYDDSIPAPPYVPSVHFDSSAISAAPSRAPSPAPSSLRTKPSQDDILPQLVAQNLPRASSSSLPSRRSSVEDEVTPAIAPAANV
ncbi:uncharacterized protein EV422DRAFT_243440 [Fimicolochytrium jonesii]|uniref:uncharacterized protein n=1 Tax=Fimicolochytrium jonesii TaxID=1396493 RepID=UPI0022FDB4D0|nr:uncharacterized protein EV422DRAFT_243440 [Fimicolochytrium jonesii]KAI8825050.1 hypothetical protein EV422DRAFT_243440 [Fimicolochytrium jonesii]